MQKVVYELTKRPPMIGKHKHTHSRLTPSPLKYMKLVDDIVYQREGDDKPKSYTIAVVAGEPSIFLKDHDDESRKKDSIEYLKIEGNYVIIDENMQSYPQIIEFLALSKKSNLKGNNRPMLTKVDLEDRAKKMYEDDKDYIEAKSFVYNKKNWETVKAYVLCNDLMTTEDIVDLGKDVAVARVASKITQANASSILQELRSEFLSRKYEMILAKEAGRIQVDSISKNVTYGDTKAILTSYEGSNPIEAAAKFTLKSEGSRAYAYIMEGLTDNGAIDDVEINESDLSGDDLETLVNKAIRLEVFNKTKKGYRLDNVLVGATKDAIIKHFNSHPEKIDRLRDAILKKI